jgi:hypothetical protein
MHLPHIGKLIGRRGYTTQKGKLDRVEAMAPTLDANYAKLAKERKERERKEEEERRSKGKITDSMVHKKRKAADVDVDVSVSADCEDGKASKKAKKEAKRAKKEAKRARKEREAGSDSDA